MRIISPSLLAADFKNIAQEIKTVEDAGAERLHLDVMDGHFVPNLTFGPLLIKAIRQSTHCHLETHLMIANPDKYIDQYIAAGSDTVIIHLEASKNPKDDLIQIKNQDICAGIAINPDTNESQLLPLIDYLDYILIMSVFPGKGGQSFISSTLDKMKNVVEMTKRSPIKIGVDGGINKETISQVYKTGIDIAIIGSGLFKAQDIQKRFQELLNA